MSSTAVIGLAGVVVGALLTGALQYFFVRHDRRQKARVAGRVVFSDLELVSNSLRTLIKNKGRITNYPLPIDSWEVHRESLAGFLSWGEWVEVAQPFDVLRSYGKALEEIEKTIERLEGELQEGSQHDFETGQSTYGYLLELSNRARKTLVEFEIRMRPFGRLRYWLHRRRVAPPTGSHGPA